MLTTLMMHTEEMKDIVIFVGSVRVAYHSEAFMSMFQEPMRSG